MYRGDNEMGGIKVRNHERSLVVYQDGVRQTFAFLKQTVKQDELYVRSIIMPDGFGYLLPVCELHADDVSLIDLLARWRQENSSAYPTQFPVTIAGTSSWLRNR